MGTASTHSGKQRTISVGILTAPQIEFCFGRDYVATGREDKVVIDGVAREEWYFASGGQVADSQLLPKNRYHCSGGGDIRQSIDTQKDSLQAPSSFTLKNVQIGKGFHWQRYQDQSFPGDLRLIAREGRVIAINVVGIEDYLQCVIASEMSPSAGMEFLKAHAVISRSWLLAQLDKRDEVREGYSSVECDTPDELVRWQDREDHTCFDFCADDHCQRYQGIPMAGVSADPGMISKTAKVIEATWGQVLWYDGRVCDARFSKCCGGALEEFKYCWENKEVPYLKYARDYESVLPSGERVPDGLLTAGPTTCETGGIGAEGSASAPSARENGRMPADLRREQAARRWILGNPRAFCNTRSKRLLGQVLKDYDSETKDFYRWRVEYSQQELHDIIRERTGDDYGDILDLIPVERGVSGRICRLKIVGTKKAKIIGKELEIRKTLSRSHLYSSAFVVEKVYCPASGAERVCEAEHRINNKSDAEQSFLEAEGRAPAKFILHGAGWGHGVVLCQIGAAAMGARGYDYRTILAHYYPNSEIKFLYGSPRPHNENNTSSR